MQREAYLHKFHRRSANGFSLIELLVALLVSGILMTAMTKFFSTAVAVRQNLGGETEADQGLRTLISLLTQELRQAGACLPRTGQFVALDGINNGTRDSLTLRIGRVNATTLLCMQPQLTTAITGGSTLQVNSASGLQTDDLLYILPAGANGLFRKVAAVSGNTISLATALPTGTYAVGTIIYPVDERTYTIDNSNPARPMLTVAIDQNSPQPLIDGAELFDVRYLLSPCSPNCVGPNSAPPSGPNDPNWRLVREIEIKATVDSHKKNRQGQVVKATTGTTGQAGEYISVKPRNLLD